MAVVLSACGDASENEPAGSSIDATAGAAQPAAAQPAPELIAIEGWHNTEALTLAGLRGKTVLIVFFSDT
ncbi:MAG TPA: hypothetical protein VMM78_05895 [Thermomicrobiales bacterium]|nr:hypothetical protein [Thermomicrobiales bacterium]